MDSWGGGIKEWNQRGEQQRGRNRGYRGAGAGAGGGGGRGGYGYGYGRGGRGGYRDNWSNGFQDSHQGFQRPSERDQEFRGGFRPFNATEERSEAFQEPPRESYRPVEIDDKRLFDQGISTGINFSKYENIPCQVTGRDPPDAIESFSKSGLRKVILDNIKRSSYTVPTPVQKHAIPAVLNDRDFMACAQTGSGKTAAFLLPIIHKLLEAGVDSRAGEPMQCPEVVIISPTRELATQIKDESRKFSHNTIIRSVVIYGGTSVRGQAETIVARGVNILVKPPPAPLKFPVKPNFILVFTSGGAG